MLAVVCMGLSSCSKDDDKTNPLVGTWVSDDEEGEDTLTFNADGSGINNWVSYENGKKYAHSDEFTYVFDTKTMLLTIKEKNPEEGELAEYTGRIELSDNVLKITYTDEDGDDWTETYHKQ